MVRNKTTGTGTAELGVTDYSYFESALASLNNALHNRQHIEIIKLLTVRRISILYAESIDSHSIYLYY